MLRILCLVVTLLHLALPAHAGGFSRADPPSWVEDLPIPAPIPAQKAQSPDGVYYLLADTQIAWEGEAKLNLTRTVTLVTERAGLEKAAAISLDYNPEFDDLALIRLNVIRDGKVIAWRDRLQEDTFRRETQLENGIIDGTLTAFLQIPDLKVGDIVDSITLRRSLPAVKGAAPAVWEFLEYGVPVAQTRVLVHWPAAQSLNIGALPERVIYSSSDEPGGKRLEWRREAPMPNAMEEKLPVEDNPDAVVRLSGDTDWLRFSKLLAGYYEAEYPLPPDWQARVDALKTQPRDKAAIAALRMVQDDIRYVSLSVGAGGIYARKPVEVIASGFGDCKDKALLYRTMLRHLGVDAAVALTDLDTGYALRRELPQSTVFDHAIVQVKLDGATHWVDPTASYQGGDFTSAGQPDYGFALPLRAKGQAFVEAMPVAAENAWNVSITESYSFSFLGLFLDVVTDYRAGAADWNRAHWAVTPSQKISDDYRGFYADHYPGIRVAAPIAMRDDRDANLLTTHELYFLPNTALHDPDLYGNFPFIADDFTSNLPDADSLPRHSPMTSGAPQLTHFVVQVLNAPLDMTAPDPVHIANAAFQLDFSASAAPGGALRMTWDFRRDGTVIAPADVEAVLRDGKAASDITWWSWDLNRAPADQ